MKRWMGVLVCGCLVAQAACAELDESRDPEPAESSSLAGGGALVGRGGGVAWLGGDGGAGGRGGGPPALIVFDDDFDRLDNPGIGNGWIEKKPDAFALVDNAIVGNTFDPSYRNNVVYRPASEALRDVVVSLEFEYQDTVVGGPALFVHGQSSTITDPDTLNGYVLVLSPTDGLILGKSLDSTPYFVMVQRVLSQPLEVSTRYRLWLSIEKVGPTFVTGHLDRWHGAWSTEEYVFQDEYVPGLLEGAGTMGFAADQGTHLILDNFHYAGI